MQFFIIKNIILNIKNGVMNIFTYLIEKKLRGIGGIFFDYKMDNWKKDFLFIKDVGKYILLPIKKNYRKKNVFKMDRKGKKKFNY